MWSVTSFACEVPSGAWADTIERRTLLVLSALVYAAGFSTWMLWPAYPGFLLGFVLWAVSSAMMSGTFEALLYDELAAVGATSEYARVTGWAHSAAMTANLAATVVAAPLFALGGYQLVGWLSVLVALVHGGLALLLPRASRSAAADAADASGGGWARRYVEMLSSGVRETSRVPVVRRAVLISSAMLGLTAYDEYFPLVVREQGVETPVVPLFVAMIVAGQAIGTGLAGRTARSTSRRIGWLYGVGAALIAVGAVSGHPVGLVLVAVGYGLVNNAFIVGQARLQETITGPARATATSVAGLSSEVFALSVFGFVAVGSLWWSVATAVAILGVPAIGAAVAAARWLPGPELSRADDVLGR